MTNEEFDNLLNEITKEMHSVLNSKAKEYQRGDRLSNFKTAGRIMNCTPETALLGMELKYRVAIYDYVRDLNRGGCMPIEQWQEKIIDSINYLVLLLALATERIEKSYKEEN